jgi:putative ABC transport system permease protein
MKPPRIAEWLIAASFGADDRDPAMGDLAEEFVAIADREGLRRARRWYWTQTRRSVWPNLRRRLSGRFDRPRGLPDSPKERLMNSLAQDFRFGWRMLRRRPLLTLVSVLSLVVGLSGALVVFGLLDAAVLRPLPVADPDRIAVVLEQRTSGVNHNFSYGDFSEFRDTLTAFKDVVAISRAQISVGRVDGSDVVAGELVTGGYFQALGIRMRIGRGLGLADDERAAPPAAVVSESLWQRYNRPALDGWTVSLNSQAFTVVGVAAAPFSGMEVGRDTRVWAPLRFQPILDPSNGRNLLELPTSWLTVMGRLKPGVTLEQAGRELTRVEATLPKLPNRDQMRRLFAAPGAQGDSMLPGIIASPLQLLLAVAGLVLAVACANVAGLLIARASERERELAVRTALGASRGRLARLLLVEAGLIGAGAIAAAVGVASIATRLAVPLLSPFGEAVALDLSLDWRVFGFGAALALGSTLLVGLIPLATVRRSLAPALAESSRGASASRGRTAVRQGLVGIQFALSLALVAVAMLLGRTFVNLRTLPTGFDLPHIAVAQVDPNAAQYSPERIEQYVQDAGERLRALPGVRGVGFARVLPLDFGGSRATIVVPGYAAGADEDMEINFNVVTDGYFDAMGIALRDGRSFDNTDVRNGPRVAVVNETMARRYWRGQRAVGLSFGFDEKNPILVVGVVPDVKYRMLREDAGPSFYLSTRQSRQTPGAFHVRTTGSPDAMMDAIRRTLAEADAAVPITRARTLADQADVNLASERMAMTIALGLSFAALLLAAVGLYAAMAHTVGQRRREIGVRLALGAVPGDVRRLVLRQGLVVAAVGSVAGAGLAIVLARNVEARLYGVTPSDVPSLLMSIGLLSVVAVLASWVPARRAARVDPVEALRIE